jgi:hypothetical protein
MVAQQVGLSYLPGVVGATIDQPVAAVFLPEENVTSAGRWALSFFFINQQFFRLYFFYRSSMMPSVWILRIVLLPRRSSLLQQELLDKEGFVWDVMDASW